MINLKDREIISITFHFLNGDVLTGYISQIKSKLTFKTYWSISENIKHAYPFKIGRVYKTCSSSGETSDIISVITSNNLKRVLHTFWNIKYEDLINYYSIRFMKYKDFKKLI